MCSLYLQFRLHIFCIYLPLAINVHIYFTIFSCILALHDAISTVSYVLMHLSTAISMKPILLWLLLSMKTKKKAVRRVSPFSSSQSTQKVDTTLGNVKSVDLSIAGMNNTPSWSEPVVSRVISNNSELHLANDTRHDLSKIPSHRSIDGNIERIPQTFDPHCQEYESVTHSRNDNCHIYRQTADSAIREKGVSYISSTVLPNGCFFKQTV